ncbi:Pentatricopeptide repeat, partial [Dillenia turbinata]
ETQLPESGHQLVQEITTILITHKYPNPTLTLAILSSTTLKKSNPNTNTLLSFFKLSLSSQPHPSHPTVHHPNLSSTSSLLSFPTTGSLMPSPFLSTSFPLIATIVSTSPSSSRFVPSQNPAEPFWTLPLGLMFSVGNPSLHCRQRKARDLLADMKSKGLFPNRNTYNILVSANCKMGASKVIELMTHKGVLPDIWTYNMLIRRLCNKGKIDEVFRLCDEMEKLKFLPDVVTYNMLIDGCLEWKSRSEALSLFEEMSGKGVK